MLRDGVQFHREGRWQRAEACYQQALRLDPRQPDALHLTGLIAHHRGTPPVPSL
ncbi:tetratricopeptide repeat protein [Defluviicoccus vanus]|uniref:tetratricopeptide repeat protein n=1 Tax=Defluviicoccus vanus TaxID=111831 RepID=UPI003899533F